MDNLRGLLGIKRMDKVPNAWIRDLCGVTKVFMVFFNGLDMWRGWSGIGSARESM